MTSSVPLTFRLPNGWQPAAPTAVGLPETTFVAVHPGSANGFTANITLAEQDRTDDATLAQLADESVARLKTLTPNVSIQHRAEVGSPDVPGFTQVLHLSTPDRDLVQCQLLVSFVDDHNPAHRVIVEIALTATPAQVSDLVEDFQEFVTTVRPDPGQVP
jgi:hypothetical protein